jgi:sugar-specific transcriptional regulator TrmB
MESLGIENDLISALENYGLTKLEAQAYLILIMKGGGEALEIAKALHIQLPQFYNIINNLQRKGFVEIQVGRPKRYRAINPEEIMQRKTEEMKRQGELLLKKFYEFHKQQAILSKPSVWITFGIKNVIYNINRIIKGAQYDTTIVMHKKYIKSIINSLRERKGKGIQTYLIIYPNELKHNVITQLNKIGKVRAFETCPFGMLAIADCEKAVLAHGLPNAAFTESYYGVVFEEPIVPTFLSENFYQLWLRSKPLYQEKEKISYPKMFRAHRMALLEIKDLLENNIVEAYVEGRYIKTGELFKSEGEIVKVTDTEFMKNFTLKTSENKEITIGGPYSTLEDIEARLIIIKKTQPKK